MDYNRIKVVLAEKKTTNKELASHLGVTEDTVSRWCRNINQPSITVLFEIADFLKESPRMLLTH